MKLGNVFLWWAFLFVSASVAIADETSEAPQDSAQDPTTEEPKQPPADQPATEAPQADGALTQAPPEETASEHPPPVTEQPPVEATSENPQTNESASAQPPADATSENPQTNESASVQPPANDPAMEKPPTVESSSVQPPVVEASSVQPPVEEVSSAQPPVVDSSTVQPPRDNMTTDMPPKVDNTTDLPTTATPSNDTEASNSSKPPWELSAYLPKNITPEHYDIFLYPDLLEGLFEGKVSIRLNIKEPLDYILVHSYKLEIVKTKVAMLVALGAECITIKQTLMYEPYDFFVIIPEEKLAPGQYSVVIKFKGDMKGPLTGLYRSSYVDNIGMKRYLATTKFEPTYARRAFPCLDEPAMKATFSVNLARPTDGYLGLSNMPKVSERSDYPGLGLTTDKFATTPLMSTYLACFIVSDFAKLPTIKSKHGVPVSAYARPGLEKNMMFARDLSAKAIDFYSQYYDINYILPKLDIIAIPDFNSGAMENWGLVTFRETSVLISEDVSTVVNYEAVSGTVCHEAAHMWFGNLVTMSWWDDLWLNEGFAAFLQSKCVDYVHPTWDITGIWTVKNTQGVLVEDALLSSHPIIQEVNHPDQISEMFDAISYNKGASVLRMLESISPPAFEKGVTNYLKKYKFKNAKTEFLWETIQEEMKEVNIIRLMGTWTKQMGYPLVNATRQGDEIVIRQTRFLSDIDLTYENDTEYKYKWDIPLTYFTSANPTKVESIILNLDSESVIVTLPPNTDWVKLNARQVGFYRVNYHDEDWDNFEGVLLDNSSAIGSLDKANLIDDAFCLANSGYLSYSIPFSFATYFRSKELDYLPWLSLTSSLRVLNRRLSSAPFHSQFEDYVKYIVSSLDTPDMWQINNSDESLVNKWKGLWVATACRYGIESCLAKAREIFKNWREGKGPEPNPNIRTAVYKAAISGDDVEKNWEKIWNMFNSEEDPQERIKLMSALASVNNEGLIRKLIELIKEESNVRSQDYFSFLTEISYTPVGNTLVWNFTKTNWDYLIKRFTLNDRRLGRLLPSITKPFDSSEQLQEVKDFIAANPKAGAGVSGRKKALATIETNIKWKEKNFDQIREWLSNWRTTKIESHNHKRKKQFI